MRSKLVTVPVTSEIEAEFMKSKGSYAICRNSPRDVYRTVKRKKRTDKQIAALLNRERVFVPVLLRKIDLKDLYWMNTAKFVVQGEVFESICHACVKKIKCSMEGQGSNVGFQCTVRADDLVKISRRQKCET